MRNEDRHVRSITTHRCFYFMACHAVKQQNLNFYPSQSFELHARSAQNRTLTVLKTTIMPKATIPSTMILPSFSQCLKSPTRSSMRCAQLSTFASSTVAPRTSPQCLQKSIAAGKAFSTSTSRTYKTVEEQRSRYRSGVCQSLNAHYTPP